MAVLGLSCLARAGRVVEKVEKQNEEDLRDKRGLAQSYIEASHGYDQSG